MQDGERFSFAPQFHAVFSNAAIHWLKNQQKVVQYCYDVLLPYGRFVAELGGANNIQSIIDAIKEAIYSECDRILRPQLYKTIAGHKNQKSL